MPPTMTRMRRRDFFPHLVAPFAALAIGGCKSKASKEAELAADDLDVVADVVQKKHVEALARALPTLAERLASRLDAASGAPLGEAATTKKLSASLATELEKDQDLRSIRRSYYAIVDALGEIVVVDDAGRWPVVGRKTADAFPSIADAIANKSSTTRGLGRFGGASDNALSFVASSPIVRAGTGIGAVCAFWEAHDCAEDLQRQRTTMLLQSTVAAKTHVKARDKNQMILDAPEMWVLLARGSFVYFEDDVQQPLVDATVALALPDKTKSAQWRGTFDVGNASWGGAARRAPNLGDGVTIAVVRHPV